MKNLRKKKKTNRRLDRFEIHATDIVKRCLREMLLLYANGMPIAEEQNYPDRTLLTFRLGLSIEDMVREMLDGKKCPPIAVRVGKLYIVGSPDIIVKDRYIVECKSINRSSFYNLSEPIADHTVQLSFYLWLAYRLPALNLYPNVGAIVYVPKEEIPVGDVFKIFEVKLQQEMINKFNKVVAQIKQFHTCGKLPPPICKAENHPKFKTCRVNRLCMERKP